MSVKGLILFTLFPILAWAQDYDVRAYGAKVDGVTNDFIALQTATSAAAKGRGTVVIPNGTLYVDLKGHLAISLSRGVRIRGLGRTSIIRTNRATPTESRSIFYIDLGDTAYFNDLSFVGPDSSGAWDSQAIHHAGGSNGLVRLDNVYIEGFTTGIKSQEGTTSILVYDSEFAQCGWGIVSVGELHSRVLVSGCIFRDTRPQTQLYRPALWHGIYTRRQVDVTVVHSRFLRITGIGVHLWDEDASITTTGGSHIISDCDFDTMRVGILSGSRNGSIDTIRNCRFTACGSGIRIQQGDADISFCEFRSGTYANSEGGCGGIHPQSISPGNISVSHSTFYLPASDPSTPGVYLYGTTSATWKLFACTFVGSGGISGSGVYNFSTAGSISVTACQFNGTYSSSNDHGAVLNEGGSMLVDSSIFDIAGNAVEIVPRNNGTTSTTLTNNNIIHGTNFVQVRAASSGATINISGDDNFVGDGGEFYDYPNYPAGVRNYQLSNRPGNGGIIQSVGTITLSRNYDTWHIQGKSVINTIAMAGIYYASEFGACKINLVADDAFSLSSAGNIIPSTTTPRSVGTVIHLEYDTQVKKWKEYQLINALMLSPTSLLFGNTINNTISSEQTYTLSGSNLSPAADSLTITAPSGFTISTVSGSGFTSSKRIAYTSGALSAKTIYVRLSPTAVQSYIGNITNDGGGATTQNVSVSGSGISSASPVITINPGSLAFSTVRMNTTSSEQTYTVQGSNLSPASGSITITSPSGYQVSVTSGSGFGSSLNVSYTGSTLSSTTIYVRFSPTVVQSYIGNITNSGGGAATQNVAMTGTGVSTATSALTANPTSLSFGNVVINTISSELTYIVTGLNLSPASDSLTITAPPGFTISTVSGSGFTSLKRIAYTGGTLSAKTIYVRFSPTAVQSYIGNITNDGGGATTQNVSVSGSGISSASPVITLNPESLTFSTVRMNTTSSEQTYTVQGSNLSPASGSITITSPSGYQVSVTSGSGFGSSLNVSYTGSTLSSTTIYVKFSPTAVQSYTGNITNSGGGAATQNVAVTGTGVSTTTSALTVNPTSLSFGNVVINTISSEQTYTLVGLNLSPAADSLTITAPPGFTISTESGSGFTSLKKIAYTGGTLRPIPKIIYVRFSPTAAQSYTGNITNSGGGAATQNVAVSDSGVLIVGALTATSQTLPGDGDTVTLRWTSQNAISASISPNIGTVPLNGSQNVCVTSETQFILTLSNGTTAVQYPVIVGNSTTSMHSESIRPKNIGLEQNFPNPFNPSTSVAYTIPRPAHVTIQVFNTIGQKIATLVSGEMSAGSHTVVWDASHAPSGVYFCRFHTADFESTKRMLLIK